VIINCRASSLEGSLRELLIRRDKPDTLNGFVFKVVGGGETSRIMARAIADSPVDRLSKHLAQRTAVDGVCRFLAEIAHEQGVDIDGPLDMMRRGWAAWIQAADDGTIKIEKWTGRFDTARAASRTFHDPADFPLTYRHFENVYKIFRSARSFSSDIDEYLAQAEAGASPAELGEIALLREWEREVRRKALAMRHRCAYRATINDTPGKRSLWKRLSDSAHHSEPRIEYPESFIHRLGRLDAESFRGALNFDDLEDWWRHGNREGLKRATERVSDSVEGRVDIGLRGIPRGIGLAEIDYTTIIGAAVGGLIGGLIAGPAGSAIGAGAPPLVERVIGVAGRGQLRRRKNVRQVTEFFDATTRSHSTTG
jgi:hypothetical protein